MTPAERVARLKQLYDQVKALNDEVALLEAEDAQFVAFKQRSQQAGRQPIGYADYVRYSAYRDQLEAAWSAAGRPRNWDQAALLVKLRDVLIVSGAPEASPPASTPVATPTATATPTQGIVPSAPASGGGAGQTAIPARPQPGTPSAAPARAQAAPGTAARVSGAATPATPVAATPAAGRAPAGTATPRAAGAPAAATSARPPSGPAPVQVSQSQLVEMHSPILNEVGDLTKRAEEEFRTGQTANALGSVERAAYLLERVAHAPGAMCQRLVKVLDEGLKEGAAADADRAR